MRRLAFAAICCLWAISCYAQTTAVRPAQILPGTPDVTVGVVGNNVQIGTTIPWRADNNASATICTGSGTGSGPNAASCAASDNATILELTNTGSITATLPVASGAFASGAGLTIQVAQGSLTLSPQGGALINGLGSIKVGPWQSAALSSRVNGNWYATLSLPQPATQTGTTLLVDSMKWQTAVGSGGGGNVAHVQDAFFQITTVGANNTVSITLSGTAGGNFFAVGVIGVNNGGSATTAVSVATNNGTTCVFSPNTLAADSTVADGWSSMSYCMNNAASGSVTFTATITNAGGAAYPGICVAEFSGVSTTAAGLGIGNKGLITATINSVATNGNLTKNNQLVVSAGTGTVSAPSVGSNQIAFTSTTNCSYQITDTAGSPVTHSFTYGSSQQNALSVAAYDHP